MGALVDFFFGGESRSTSLIDDAVQKFLAGEDSYPTPTAAGTAVTPTTAMAVTAVYACVGLIAKTLASLPLPVYRRMAPRGKERATEHPIYKLLHDAPNPEMTAYKFRELLSTHQNLWGAGIAEIQYDRGGKPVALWPLPPWKVTPERTTTGSLVYILELDNGQRRPIPANKLVVFPALSTSSYKWLSPISLHRETIGAAMAVKEFGARTFGQGTNPAAVIMTGKLSETARKSLHEDLKGYSGLSNSHRLMLLEEGLKYERVGLPPEDAQYLETRRFDISEIARIYNVPLYMLQDHEKQTSWGTGIEEQKDGFVTFTIRPYLVQWEQELNRRLLSDDSDYFAEFLIEGLLRGKMSERYNAYVQARQWGWMSANDIREIENMNPLPDKQGDIYLVPLNMQSAEFAGEKPEKTAPVKEAPAQGAAKEGNNANKVE